MFSVDMNLCQYAIIYHQESLRQTKNKYKREIESISIRVCKYFICNPVRKPD